MRSESTSPSSEIGSALGIRLLEQCEVEERQVLEAREQRRGAALQTAQDQFEKNRVPDIQRGTRRSNGVTGLRSSLPRLRRPDA